MPITLSEHLASRLQAITFADLSPDAKYWGKISIIDTLGVALAGSREPCTQIAHNVIAAGAPGQNVVFGRCGRASALDAAQINGTAAHALDFDASNNTFAGHPSVHILPALFAAAELTDANGADFLTAYIAGFELQGRMARGSQPHQSDLGWFPSSCLGVIGAAAAVAHLLRLDKTQIALALGLAANCAAGLMANAGTMAKPLAAGHSARNALLSALLAQRGFTASLDALEDRRGFFPLFSGAGNFEPERMLADWGQPYEILETAVGIKRHPCCGVLQSAVDIMADLVAKHGLTPANVANVEAMLFTKRFGHVNRPDPRSSVDAKFSLQYCVARTLENGRLIIDDFEGDAFHGASTLEVMKIVIGSEHPSMGPTASRSAQGGAELRATTTDGRVFSGLSEQPLGRIPGKPLPEHMLHEKFFDSAERALSSTGAQEVLRALANLEDESSVRTIAATMEETVHAH